MKKLITLIAVFFLMFVAVESYATIVIHADVPISIFITGDEIVHIYPTYIIIYCVESPYVCVMIIPNSGIPPNTGVTTIEGEEYYVDMNYTVTPEGDDQIVTFPIK